MSKDKKCLDCGHVECKCKHKKPKPPPPTYKRIEFILPTPPGVPPLPPRIYFDFDTRLSERELRTVIDSLITSWLVHYRETAADGTSEWARCAQVYAKKNLTPVWLDKERKKLITDGEKALEFAMDTLTVFFMQNGTWNAPVAKIDYLDPSSGSTMISRNGDRQFHVPLDVSVNPESLTTVGILNLSGSLFHAWLHRMGYRHPEDKYTTYLIGEAPMCLMRGFQDKVAPDSVLTQFFD